MPRPIRSPEAAVVLLLAGLALFPGCRRAADLGADNPVTLEQIPEVDLAAAEPAVRDQLESGRRRAAEALESPDTPGLDRAASQGELGLLYLTYGFHQAAETCFVNASRLDPTNHAWPYAAGYAAELESRTDDAVRLLLEAVKRAPDDLPSRLRLSRVLLDQGEIEAARPHVEHALELSPTSAAAMFGMGRVRAADGDHQGAVELFEQVLELQPRASSASQALALSLRQLGQTERARQALERGGDSPVMFNDPVLQPTAELGLSADLYLQRASGLVRGGLYPEAAADLARAVSLEPENLDARRMLAFCLQQSGDIQGAITAMQGALEVGRTVDGELSDAGRAEIELVLGRLQIEGGDTGAAEPHFRKALSLVPSLPEGHLLLANLLARGGRLTEAVTHLDAVLQARPEDADALLRRATALINLGRSGEARRDLLKAARSSDGQPTLQLRVADGLDHLGEHEAAASLRQAAQNAPGGQQSLAARTGPMLRLARQHLAEGRLEAAAKELQQALEIDPALTGARIQLAALLGHQGRLADAIEQYELVIAQEPDNAAARHGQVTALLLLDRLADARAALESGLRALPRDRMLATALARLLASAPDASVRDADAALHAAEALVASKDDVTARETLAMALAEAGRTDRAAATQLEVIESAGSAGGSDLESLRRARLEAYEEGRPWRMRSTRELLDEVLARRMPRG